KVLEIINNLAEKTNMLSLNAAIEAARAGEAGKGFGIVANEVKELASQTADSTKMISKLIDTIQDSSHQTADSIEALSSNIEKIDQANRSITERVEDQSSLSGEITDSVGGVVAAVQTVADSASVMQDRVGYISDATREMVDNTSEIADAARQLAASAHEVAAGSEGASFKTQEVQNTVNNVLQMTANVQKQTLKLIYLSHNSTGLARVASRLIDMSMDAFERLVGKVKLTGAEKDQHGFLASKEEYLILGKWVEQVIGGMEFDNPPDLLQRENTALAKRLSEKQWPVPGASSLAGCQQAVHRQVDALMKSFVLRRDYRNLQAAMDFDVAIFDKERSAASGGEIETADSLFSKVEEVNRNIDQQWEGFKSELRRLFALIDQSVEESQE
ncbi:MAG: hypothetical protein HQL50_14535, partial [Magnetococcales bacterium]|nr:hypothetical protein [Magnetococcales bacterium]